MVVKVRGKYLRNEVGGKFRVVVGIHLGDGPPGCDCDGCLSSDGKNHVYEAYEAYLARWRTGKHPDKEKPDQPPQKPEEYTADLIDSPVDLVRRMGEKFQRVHSGEAGQQDALARAREEGYLAGLAAAQSTSAGAVHALPTSEAATVLRHQSGTGPVRSLDLDAMTIQELRQYAESEEVDLSGVDLRSKEALRQAIRGAGG